MVQLFDIAQQLYGITCHLTQVNAPCVTPARKDSTRLIYPVGSLRFPEKS